MVRCNHVRSGALPAPTCRSSSAWTLEASWTDATGGDHQLSFASDVSSLALTNNVILPPDDLTIGGGGPIVRTINPATAGVIPIALSTTSVSASSNPMPELVGQQQQPADRRHEIHRA